MRKAGNGRGITLIELMVTLVVGSIFFVTVGMLLVNSQEGWRRALGTTSLHDSFRYCRTKMEYEIRNATGPFTVGSSSASCASSSSEITFMLQGRCKKYFKQDNKLMEKFTDEISASIMLDRLESWVIQRESATITITIDQRSKEGNADVMRHDRFSVNCRNVCY